MLSTDAMNTSLLPQHGLVQPQDASNDRKPPPSVRQRRNFLPLEVDHGPDSFGDGTASASNENDSLSPQQGISHLMRPSSSSQSPQQDLEGRPVNSEEGMGGSEDEQSELQQPTSQNTPDRRVSYGQVKKAFSPKSHGVMNGSHAVFVIACLLGFLFMFYVIIGGERSPAASEKDARGAASRGDSSASNRNPYPSGTTSFGDELWSARKERFREAHWMESSPDDYLRKVHASNQLTRQMKEYRQLQSIVEPYFDGMCGHYRFNHRSLPLVSVVVAPIYPNLPPGLLSLTVESVLARTPPDMLHEIILVLERTIDQEPPVKDDPATDAFTLEVNRLEHLTDKIKVLRCDPKRCAWRSRVQSRLAGYKETSMSEVVVFMDPYMEVMSSTWLQQLVLPLVEDPRTISVPVLHSVELEGRKYNKSETSASYFVNLDAQLNMVRMPRGFGGKSTPSSWQSHNTPYMESWMFAVDRNEFNKLNEIEGGLVNTQAESIGLSLKYQMCHGRIQMVPCSRVGRIQPSDQAWVDPDLPGIQKVDLGIDTMRPGRTFNGNPVSDIVTTLAVRNFLRTSAIWMTHSEREKVYAKMFGTEHGQYPESWIFYKNDWEDDDMDFNREELVESREHCHDYTWFVKHVVMGTLGQHDPWF